MKLFFMSDIHGSLYYLKKALENFEREGADYICILGDELYHGPRNPLPREYAPKEAAQLLNGYAEKIIAVRGNCDSEVDEMMLEFPIMAAYSSVLYEGRRILLSHGHVYGEDNLPSLKTGDIFAYGHTHIPRALKKDGIFIFNPGSAALPKENYPNSYGVLEGDIFRVRDMEGKVFMEIRID